jgi:hypothetical protein
LGDDEREGKKRGALCFELLLCPYACGDPIVSAGRQDGGGTRIGPPPREDDSKNWTTTSARRKEETTVRRRGACVLLP